MGKRLEAIFKERFGHLKFVCIYPDKPMQGEERCLHNKKIVEAYTVVLTEILGRPPADDELLGKVDISKKIKAEKEDSK